MSPRDAPTDEQRSERHGLPRASFIPDRPLREPREVTRDRTALIRERGAEANRPWKTLEGANTKLGDVASKVLGTSAREMLAGLVAGEEDVVVRAECAKRRLRAKIPQLQRALDRGRLPRRARPACDRAPAGPSARMLGVRRDYYTQSASGVTPFSYQSPMAAAAATPADENGLFSHQGSDLKRSA